MEQVKQIARSPMFKKIMNYIENFNINSILPVLFNIVLTILIIETVLVLVYSLIQLTEKNSDIIHYVTIILTSIVYIFALCFILNRAEEQTFIILAKILLIKFIMTIINRFTKYIIYITNNILIYIKGLSYQTYIKIEVMYSTSLSVLSILITVYYSFKIADYTPTIQSFIK